MITAAKAQEQVVQARKKAYTNTLDRINVMAGMGKEYCYSGTELLPEDVQKLIDAGYQVEMTNIGEHKISWSPVDPVVEL